MGTDIYAAIEYYNGIGVPEMSAHVDIDRDYDLFAILGNVRNGVAFAGVKTGNGFVPMSDQRGYPDDITPEADAVMSHEHSATWVTLAEILAYDWTRTTSKWGVVNAIEFERWDRMREWEPEPRSYCGGVTGPNVQHVSIAEMRNLVKSVHGEAAALETLAYTYCTVEWSTSYAEAATQLWHKVLPLMLKLGVLHGYENVRLVMDFDS